MLCKTEAALDNTSEKNVRVKLPKSFRGIIKNP